MLKNILKVLIALGIFGLLITPYTTSIFCQEKEARLLPPHDPVAENKLEQQIAIVSLGGLRTLVAAILSLEAFNQFQNSNWGELERRYRQIVTLAPHTPAYWDTGAWHLAFNAVSSFQKNPNIPIAERRRLSREYIAKGKNFLKEGIVNNPDSWYLYLQLGSLLSNPLKNPNFLEAAIAYEKAAQLGASSNVLRYQFYSLARVPEKSREAWELGRKLYKIPSNQKFPSLLVTLFALENRLDIPENQRIPFNELFPSVEYARSALSNQLTNHLDLPKDGLRETLEALPPPRKTKK